MSFSGLIPSATLVCLLCTAAFPQEKQKGDGHAILQARELINDDEAFLVIFGDCLYTGDNVLEKMQTAYQENNKTIIAVQEVEKNQVDQYGIVELKDSAHHSLPTINSFIEKPSPTEAPSNLAIIGRYLLTPSIWPNLAKELSESGEVRLIDALQDLQKQEDILALKLSGKWLDTGTLEGLQKAGELLKTLT